MLEALRWLMPGLALLALAPPALADEAALPGRNADPQAIYPPGERIRQSGAPAEWPSLLEDEKTFGYAVIDRLEYGDGDGVNSYLWDAQAWLGGDLNKLWVKTEGEGPERGEGPEDTEFQLLYNRTISPFFGLQAGLRHDTNPGDDRSFAVLGLQGLAPYWFETDTSLFVSDNGKLSLRGEFEYDQHLTQRLILQPRLELNASAQDVPEYGLGQGLNNIETGLRLRYELRREFAPYVGVRHEALLGETEDIAKRAGEPGSSTSFVVGLRAWY